MSKILLNLGAGDDIRLPAGPGWHVINHDLRQFREEINAAWDLNKRPWPWGDESIWTVVAQSVLEHLNLTLVESLNECWRILRPGGELHLKLPLWDNANSYTDPTHRWVVAPGVLRYFDGSEDLWRKTSRRYTIRPWTVDYEGLATTSLIARLRKRLRGLEAGQEAEGTTDDRD